MDTIRLIEQTPQSQVAKQALSEASKPPYILVQYGVLVRQICRVLQRHGLGQTLAYIQVRSSRRINSPYELLGRQLDHWLLTTLGVSGRSALGIISSRDCQFYLEASEQAWLFLRALRAGLEDQS